MHVVKILAQQLCVVKAARRELANAVDREARAALGRPSVVCALG